MSESVLDDNFLRRTFEVFMIGNTLFLWGLDEDSEQVVVNLSVNFAMVPQTRSCFTGEDWIEVIGTYFGSAWITASIADVIAALYKYRCHCPETTYEPPTPPKKELANEQTD